MRGHKILVLALGTEVKNPVFPSFPSSNVFIIGNLSVPNICIAFLSVTFRHLPSPSVTSFISEL